MRALLLALATVAAFLVLTAELAERDQRIAALEQATACRPARDGDTTTYTHRQGRLECALTIRQGGKRVIAYRSTHD